MCHLQDGAFGVVGVKVRSPVSSCVGVIDGLIESAIQAQRREGGLIKEVLVIDERRLQIEKITKEK